MSAYHIDDRMGAGAPDGYGPGQEIQESYFEIDRGRDRFTCVLVARGDEWSAQLFKNEVFDHHVGPFESREEACSAADVERAAIDRGELDGW
jgi:hypothetical protein